MKGRRQEIEIQRPRHTFKKSNIFKIKILASKLEKLFENLIFRNDKEKIFKKEKLQKNKL